MQPIRGTRCFALIGLAVDDGGWVKNLIDYDRTREEVMLGTGLLPAT